MNDNNNQNMQLATNSQIKMKGWVFQKLFGVNKHRVINSKVLGQINIKGSFKSYLALTNTE
jgi:hypothetical protein